MLGHVPERKRCGKSDAALPFEFSHRGDRDKAGRARSEARRSPAEGPTSTLRATHLPLRHGPRGGDSSVGQRAVARAGRPIGGPTAKGQRAKCGPFEARSDDGGGEGWQGTKWKTAGAPPGAGRHSAAGAPEAASGGLPPSDPRYCVSSPSAIGAANRRGIQRAGPEGPTRRTDTERARAWRPPGPCGPGTAPRRRALLRCGGAGCTWRRAQSATGRRS